MLSDRRGLAAAVLLCLVGAFVVLVAAGRGWASVDVLTGPITGAREVSVAGTQVAPGVRALEVIEELEPLRRNLYAGTVGYFDAGGDMDMAIAIRTAVLHGGSAYVQAGAGIVADSDPATEQLECENKAAAVLRALAGAASLRPVR